MLVQAANAPAPERLLKLRNASQLTAWAGRFEHGEGVPRSAYWAIRLYCQAAKRGHAEAQYSLGWLYANGRGVGRDESLAAAWFKRAAARGHYQAERMLALMATPATRVQTRCVLPLPDGKLAGESGPRSERVLQVTAWVEQLAPQYGLDVDLVLAVIAAESGFNPNARSVKNAQGLMQLIPATAERFGVNDTFNPRQNLRGGMAYLRWLLAYFQGDVELALAGYNAGEGAVDKYRGIPPFAETRAYVSKITQRYGKRRHPPVEQVVKPSALLASR